MLFNAAALLVLIPAAFAIPARPKAGDIIPGQYIVVMKDTVSTADFSAHQDFVIAKKELSKRGKTAAFSHTYNFGKLKGYAGKFDEATIEEIANRPEVSIRYP